MAYPPTSTLIISETKLRSFSDINNNVDAKLLTTAISTAQDIYLQRIFYRQKYAVKQELATTAYLAFDGPTG